METDPRQQPTEEEEKNTKTVCTSSKRASIERFTLRPMPKRPPYFLPMPDLLLHRNPRGNFLSSRCERHGRWEKVAQVVEAPLNSRVSGQLFTLSLCHRCETVECRKTYYRLFRCQHTLCENCIGTLLEHHNCESPCVGGPSSLYEVKA